MTAQMMTLEEIQRTMREEGGAEKLFREGVAPEAKTLVGLQKDEAPDPKKSASAQWSVWIGFIAWLCVKLRWRKQILIPDPAKPNEIAGCNVFRRKLRRGHFKVGPGIYDKKLGGDEQAVLVLNYGVKQNGKLWSPVIDELRITSNPGVLIGRFHYVVWGKKVFCLYFLLIRIPEASAFQPAAA